MDISIILKELDEAFERADTEAAEEVLVKGIAACMEEGDDGALLQLLNEYLGFLRETGRADESYVIAGKILELSDRMGLKGSIPHATSLLNIANAYRAGGRLEDSLRCYDEAEEVYKASLPADSMLFASFYNNKALLFQEMGEYAKAAESLRKALPIVEKKGESFETAVTHANLANTYLGLADYVLAGKEGRMAKELFEASGNLDSHYASALYALGLSEVKAGRHHVGRPYLKTALDTMEKYLGKNEFYYRIKDALTECEGCEEFISGMEIAEKYCNELFIPAVKKELPEYIDRIATGLVGRGSDCFNYDDGFSRDHDWGPGFCVFVTKDTYDEIGGKLEELYASLPEEFMGYKAAPKVSTHKRRGVFVIEDFYRDILGVWPVTEDNFISIPDYALAAATNGKVFNDPEGAFTKIRNSLLSGYPESVLYLKLAQGFSVFSQTAQYNYERSKSRGDEFTASIMLSDGLREAMKIAHYLEGKYPPHDKWLFKSSGELDCAGDLLPLLSAARTEGRVNELGAFLAEMAYRENCISDTDDYLDHHKDELLFKSEASKKTFEELVKETARTEFDAFDKVKNEGGRADCQNDWYTFSIMRESQYMTWTKTMLLQYLYDFKRELSYGHNLITEKYGRMMESTAPEKYEEIKDHFPLISPEKKSVIEAIVGIQVGWMHEFTEKYPKLGNRARSVDTFDDNIVNTSYETYLRGEISTYSDKMLQLYGAFIASLAGAGENLAEKTMENSVKFYGYESLKDAEAKA
ncbi:MAG: DUF4125 family protein [Lachnospiraceae bacterium]|nr:DUF4125 family protein [Lachnospiraceae bacterium]